MTRRPAGDDGTERGGRDERVSDRSADHSEIERLTEDLLPALIAKLSASGLGEIEVGEGAWRVRVRRPADAASGQARRTTDRASRSQPGHAGHGHAPGGFESHRGGREDRAATVSGHSTNGASPGAEEGLHATADGPTDTGSTSSGRDPYRVVATSPAVGIYQPRAETRAGTRVRAGDRLGSVDMLGVPQQVVAPADGIVGASLAEAGQAVEYGQDLVVIELATQPSGGGRIEP
jgi:biotin carboxyl carrier protein